MNDASDDELRARFAALRVEEAMRAPDFRGIRERVSGRARTRPRLRPAVILGLAAAAALVLATGVALHGIRNAALPPLVADSTPSGAGAGPLITTWTSPTAGLLRTSASELLSAPPPIRSSILDGVASAPTKPKGD
jgi:anti-sigma factor RsiW